MNLLPQTTTHPIRQPFTVAPQFLDGAGPPPLEFFGATQQSLLVQYHARLGTDWSALQQDFDAPVYRPGYLGDLLVTKNFAAGITLRPVPDPMGIAALGGHGVGQGEHGVWSGLTGVFPAQFEAQGGASYVGPSDFLINAKVMLINRAALDPLYQRGFWIGCGPPLADPDDGLIYPGFVAGGDSPNWNLWYAPPGTIPHLYDTGVPIYDNFTNPLDVQPWYVLQISRVAGALRFFINGRLIRIEGREGVFDSPDGTEITSRQRLRRYVRFSRFNNGAANEGFLVDRFDQLLQRIP